jgi:hypothetical protein
VTVRDSVPEVLQRLHALASSGFDGFGGVHVVESNGDGYGHGVCRCAKKGRWSIERTNRATHLSG